MPRIRRLDVQGFRGIRQEVGLLIESKSVLLFGENGTGKSSFVDALERLLVGRVSTLDGRAAGLSSERHGPHIRSGPYPTRIALTFDDAAATVLDLQTDKHTLPPPIKDYLNAAGENVYILRRRQILDFIESQPRDRYGFLRPFIPLSSVEAIEEVLRQARDQADRESQSAMSGANRLTQDLQRAVTGLSSVREPSELDLVSSLSEQLTALGFEPIRGIDEAASRIEHVSGALASFGDVSHQTGLTAAIRAFEEVTEGLSRLDVLPLAVKLADLREREIREAQVFYEAVLQQGMQWIAEASLNSCPLCEQSIDRAYAMGRIQARLSVLRELLELRRSARNGLQTLRLALRSANEAVARAEARTRDLVGDERTTAVGALNMVRGVIAHVDQAAAEDVTEISTERLRAASRNLEGEGEVLTALKRCLEQLRRGLADLPSAEIAQRFLALRDCIVRASDIWRGLSEARSVAKQAEWRARIAANVFEDAQSARKEEVQLLFNEVSKEINEMYVRLHPDESHGGVRLELREAVQGSANIRADFYDRQDEDPRAYYSEAHLDTLGLSIFLTLRRWYRRQKPSFDLLVLDDVLSSVDTAHSIRLAELLLTEFGDYQVLLTTHDRIWFEHLRDIQARCGKEQMFVNKVIHKWTIDEGPDIREPEDERRAIERLVEDGSAESIAAMAGRLLEHVLQEMRYGLRLSIQAKRGEQYEIGELWPAFYATVKRDYGALFERGRKAFEALDVRWPLRNWIGAHWNIWARNVSRNSAVEFAQSVKALFDLVFCSSCRRFVTPSTTPLGQLACRCGDRIYAAPGKEPVRPRSRDELVLATQGSLKDAQVDTSKFFEAKRTEARREG